MHTPPDDRPVRQARRRALKYRAGVLTTVTAGLAATGLLVITGGVAVASSQATVAQVEKKLNQLTSKEDKLDQQLDQVKQELAAANQRLAVVKREQARDAGQFNAMRGQIGQIAAQAYEQGTLNTSIALLTSGKPQQILDQSSILLELSSANNAEMNQFLAAARAGAQHPAGGQPHQGRHRPAEEEHRRAPQDAARPDRQGQGAAPAAHARPAQGRGPRRGRRHWRRRRGRSAASRPHQSAARPARRCSSPTSRSRTTARTSTAPPVHAPTASTAPG